VEPTPGSGAEIARISGGKQEQIEAEGKITLAARIPAAATNSPWPSEFLCVLCVKAPDFNTEDTESTEKNKRKRKDY
jgi:hypothetical protein